jgi:hypothetical protein
MNVYVNRAGLALAALLSLAVAVVALAISAAPALALAIPGARTGHGFSAPVQGGGSTSLVGMLVVVAILAAAVIFAVIGWRYDQRRVARSQQSGSASGALTKPRQAGLPSASKPLPMQTAPAVRARRDHHDGERVRKPTT